MKEYKRLTERRNHIVIDKCCNCENVNNPQGCYHSDCHRIMKNRLAELEDKIEQGTMKEINDKLIGEGVYGIHKDTTGKYWYDDDEHILLGFTSDGIVTWNDNHGYNDYFKDGLWFLTREEAEKRLKELQE